MCNVSVANADNENWNSQYARVFSKIGQAHIYTANSNQINVDCTRCISYTKVSDTKQTNRLCAMAVLHTFIHLS